MVEYTPRLTTAAYGIILILFFLPFISIKCNHKELEKVKGIELATGFRIGNHSTDSSQQMFNVLDSVGASFHHNGNESNQASDLKMERNNFASAALLLAIGGFVLSFLMQWRREMLQGIIGLAGMMSLFLMRVQVDNEYVQHHNTSGNTLLSNEMIIEYETGYWLVLISFLIIAAINISAYIDQMKNGKMEISDGLPGG